MSVYVDNMQAPYGQMVMCHMAADTSEELLAMVDAIGVDRRWIQCAGTYREHFDISKAKRFLAVRLGAKAVTTRKLVGVMRAKAGRKGFFTQISLLDSLLNDANKEGE